MIEMEYNWHMDKLAFPKGFLWGAATSSHQVEGGTNNDWSEWERSPGRREALEKTGRIARYGYENFISGAGVDHYNRFAEDFSLARELGHNATRFSIEWSRIEPREGYYDDRAIEHYREVVKAAKENGLEPFVTLWHWTVPLWFRDMGGLENRKNIHYFARFVQKMAMELLDVKFWITLNEPEIYTASAYWDGSWPPEKKNPIAAFRVFHNLIRAHRASYALIKSVNPKAQIGIAKNNGYFEAYKNRPWNLLLKKTLDRTWNFYFLNRIRDAQDFIGLNYYFHSRIKGKPNRNENKKISDLGWELYPEGIYHVLRDLGRYNVPIYITENGLADAKDADRAWFIRETLRYVHRAIEAGVDVRGYLHWSLMDNFEWAHGFWPRFGLVAVDYETKARRPRPSALVYKKICEENAIEI
jgi:beta-glucosidase